MQRPRPDDREPPGAEFPDPGPLRRVQVATAGLIALAAVVTLLSDARPEGVRWGALIGLALLLLVVAVVLRRRGRSPGGDGES